MELQIKPTDVTGKINPNSAKDISLQHQSYHTEELFARLAAAIGKKSFLIFKQNKYFTVPVEKIAFFHIKYESPAMMCMDKAEYPVSHSLDQLQNLLAGKQFFRVNRQYLVNFTAIKEVEHYFARKLLINLIIGTADKLIVSKDRANDFLNWLENR